MREQIGHGCGINATLPPFTKASRPETPIARRSSPIQPTRQAKWVAWHLTMRVPLNFVALPEEEIASSCARCGLTLETWRRQELAFGLMRKVYAKRAEIRGEPHPVTWTPRPQVAWESD